MSGKRCLLFLNGIDTNETNGNTIEGTKSKARQVVRQVQRKTRKRRAKGDLDDDEVIKHNNNPSDKSKETKKKIRRKAVRKLLSESRDGLILIENFMEPSKAMAALRSVQSVNPKSWHLARNDPRDRGAARHRYHVGDGSVGEADYNDDIEKLLTLVGETALPHADPNFLRFQLGKYTRGDQIAPHNDMATQMISMIDGSRPVRASRKIALVYYLTKDWTSDMGGQFVDLHQGRRKEYVPKFNSLVAFTVPRLHSVKPVTTSRPRHSIFGWLYVSNTKKSKRKDQHYHRNNNATKQQRNTTKKRRKKV